MKDLKIYKVTYTKKIGVEGTILIKAHNEESAVKYAKNACVTGSDFRNPVETDEKYVKPSKQGFKGRG